MDFAAQLAAKKGQLQETETVVRHLTTIVGGGVERKAPEQRICVLIVSKYLYAFHLWLSRSITKVLLTTTDVVAHADFEVQKAYAKLEGFDDYDTNGMLEVRAAALHREHDFTHVLALVEDDLLRAAQIRRMLGLRTGQSVESATRFRDKIVMKQVVAAAGLRTPVFAPLESPSEAVAFIAKNGYPCVVKPRRGQSSIGVSVLRSDADLERLLRRGLNTTGRMDASLDLDIECFVTGDMYHVDGLVANGQVRLVWPSTYLSTVASFGANRFVAGMSCRADDPVTRPIQDYVVAVIGALTNDCPVDNFTFHAEVWVQPTGEIVLCEIASRTGGGEIRNQILELFGIKLDQSGTQLMCGDTVSNARVMAETWQERRPIVDFTIGWLFMYPTQGILRSAPTTCPDANVMNYTFLGTPGKTYAGPADCADALASFCIKGTSEDVLSAATWFDATCVWETATL